MSESNHVKMPHCWKSHVVAQLFFCESDIHLPSILYRCSTGMGFIFYTYTMGLTILFIKQMETIYNPMFINRTPDGKKLMCKSLIMQTTNFETSFPILDKNKV